MCCSDYRELVKLFTTEKSFVDELKQFLEELVIRISVSIFVTHYVCTPGGNTSRF